MRLLELSLICLLLTGASLGSENSGVKAEINKLLPDWKIERLAVGDLNRDGKSDVAVILSQTKKTKDKSEEASEEKLVTLQVFLRNSSTGKLTFKTDAPKAVCGGCGGVKENFEISILKGVLILNFYSGAAAFDSQVITKWRLQNEDFDLIGVTVKESDISRTDITAIERDANITTLKMTEKVFKVVGQSDSETPKTKPTTMNCIVPATYKGHKLSSYSLEVEDSFPKCSKVELK